jgi:hypothetical protein
MDRQTLAPLEPVFPHSWQDLYAVIIELTAPGDDCSSLRSLRGKLEEKLRSEHNGLIADIKTDVYNWLKDKNNIELDSLRDVANQIDIERPGELGQNTLAERIKDTIIPQNKLVRLMEALLHYFQGTSRPGLAGPPIAREQGPPQRVNSATLRTLITTHFNDNELRNLCYDIEIDYESLPGEGKSGKARELIAYVQRRGKTSQLIAECRRLRPHVEWPTTT